MNKHIFILIFIAVGVLVGVVVWYGNSIKKDPSISSNSNMEEYGGPEKELDPLSIEYMRSQEYSGSEIIIEQPLPSGSNYDRYITSYKSDGLKIFALLTVPQGEKPTTGWPVILFNHGYIPPSQYRTTEKYIAYTDAFSRNGYIVFKSDYRGHGNSEGNPEGAHYSPAYTIDILNAVSSIKKLKDPSTGSGLVVDPKRIGMWGHSMGGMITLRSMVINKDIRVGEIWSGVVASYEDLVYNWHRPNRNLQPTIPLQNGQVRRSGRQGLVDKYGSLEENPSFWKSISPISFVNDVSGPIQLQHGTADETVPLLFSQKLDAALKKTGKSVKFFTYEGDDHNLSYNLDTALARSVEFFDNYLK